MAQAQCAGRQAGALFSHLCEVLFVWSEDMQEPGHAWMHVGMIGFETFFFLPEWINDNGSLHF